MDSDDRAGVAAEERGPATILEGRIVGHIPYNLAKCVSQFFSRDVSKVLCRLQATELIVELDMGWKYLSYTTCIEIETTH